MAAQVEDDDETFQGYEVCPLSYSPHLGELCQDASTITTVTNVVCQGCGVTTNEAQICLCCAEVRV